MMEALIDRFGAPVAVLLLSSLVAWSVTEAYSRWIVVTDWPSRRMRNALLRTISVVVGAMAGHALGRALPEVGGWPWGTLAGAAGGGTTTIWIAWLRARTRREGASRLPAGHDDGRHSGGAP